MNDFLLIIKMKQGDESALDTFVRKYYPQILQYCRFHCFDVTYAEDLTQETFLHFFCSLPSYRHIGKAKNYLYTIAGNLCKNYAKKKAALPAEQEVLEQELSFSDKMEQTELKIDMEQALWKLPTELREPIILFYFQECKLTEIAEILQIGLPLVKYRLKRGKESLKDLLKDTGRGEIAEKSALKDTSRERITEKSAGECKQERRKL